MQSDFQPWEANYSASCWLLIAGLAIGWSLQIADHAHWATLVSAIGTYYGWQQYAIGRPREFGIEVEHQAVADLRLHLIPLNYHVAANLMLERGGNIDAIVALPNGTATFVVEIKSYRGLVSRWWGGLTKLGKPYPLFREPRQVRRQCAALGSERHFPVLWCPISTLNRISAHGDILLVNGDVNALRFGLDWYQDNVALPVSVTFPRMPPVEYRQELKNRRFIWNRANRTWYGRTTLRTGAMLAESVARVGGQFRLRRR